MYEDITISNLSLGKTKIRSWEHQLGGSIVMYLEQPDNYTSKRVGSIYFLSILILGTRNVKHFCIEVLQG